MYGLRGTLGNVDLLSPYEMLMHWGMEAVKPPSSSSEDSNAELTEEGLRYRKACLAVKAPPDYEPGVHYAAKDSKDRILLPDLATLQNLRHRWLWARRRRLEVPTWSYAKVPKSNQAPEENARLLCIYMRPWTLNTADVSEHVPLLSSMAGCTRLPEKGADVWIHLQYL